MVPDDCSTLLLALGEVGWQSYVHVWQGYAYASDGHRLHRRKVEDAVDCVLNARWLRSTDPGIANQGTVMVARWTAHTENPFPHRLDLDVNELLKVPRIAKSKVRIPLISGFSAEHDPVYTFQIGQREQKRITKLCDKSPLHIAGGSFSLSPEGKQELRRDVVWVDLDYLLNAIEHAGTGTVRFFDHRMFRAVIVGSDAIVMPIRPD